VSIVVQDNGLGIPAEERAKVTKRFYRLDRSRSLPGNGLGLPIVAAISHLHSGTLFLEDAAPGLIARIVLPRVDAATLPNVNVLETEPSSKLFVIKPPILRGYIRHQSHAPIGVLTPHGKNTF
jgi:hypothetical protein